MKNIRYKFEDYEVHEDETGFSLVTKNDEKANHEQKILFTQMLNFGYINFKAGDFSVTSKDIFDFWNYAKSNILENVKIEKYYSLLNLPEPYTERLPSIETKGAFSANDFSMSVVWKKQDSKMFSSPVSFEQSGLKLKDKKFGDTVGSLFPEYFELYSKIDDANESWKNWNLKQRYEFLDNLDSLSKKREILIPKNLQELKKR